MNVQCLIYKSIHFFSLEEDIFDYAKQNLAVVNVYIKDPVVTRILRDQKIPIIAFVANTGGLLGLCMGFSLVSLFEIVYHLLGALKKMWWPPKSEASQITSSVSLKVESNGINNVAQTRGNSNRIEIQSPSRFDSLQFLLPLAPQRKPHSTIKSLKEMKAFN